MSYIRKNATCDTTFSEFKWKYRRLCEVKMITNLFFISFLLVLGGCRGALFGLLKNNPEFDIDKYEYKGDPIGFSCIYDESQTNFHQVKVNGTYGNPTDLIERLNNGKGLSLYFDGIGSRVKPNGSTFNFAKEWFTASDSNICYVTYAYEKIPDGPFDTLLTAREMVKTHRLQYAAKVVRDLVLGVREQCIQNETPGCLKNMSQVMQLGFSFGAHIASQTCINLFNSTGEKVGKLFGVDPAGIALTLKRFNQAFIKRGDAAYVQIIHTDPMLYGTMLMTGDVDIVVDDVPTDRNHKHGFAVYLHMATSMKKLILIAEENGKGDIITIDDNFTQQNEVPKENEVFIGVYSELEESKRGKKFKISFKDRDDILRKSIAHVVKMR